MRGSGFGEGAFYRAVSLASRKEIGRLCLKMRVFRIFADGLAGFERLLSDVAESREDHAW